MEPVDADLAVALIEDKKIRQTSKSVYLGAQVGFVQYLVRQMVGVTLGTQVTLGELDATEMRSRVREMLKLALQRKSQDFLLFEEIEIIDLKRYFATLTLKDGVTPAGKSTAGTARSAILNLYETFGQVMSDEMQGAITSFWKGMARNLADLKADGRVKIDEGKRAIPIELYRKLLLAMMQSARSEAVFCHVYAVLSANLGCRTNNTARVALSHISASEDNCTILFAQTKCDQEGEMEMFKRHLFANPYEPSVCLITSLGIYLACVPFRPGQVKLFEGSKPDNRFLKELHAFLAAEPMDSALASAGYTADEFGSHSIGRKTLSSYCSSVSTIHSHVALCNRMSWKLPGAQPRYLQMRADDFGDCVIGRIFALLPVNAPEFGALPPHFREDTPEVRHSVKVCFPNAPANLSALLEVCLASLIFHRDYLRRTLHRDHKLFLSPLFADQSIVANLSPLIEAGLARPQSRIQPTGVPTLTTVLLKMQSLERKVDEIVPAVDGVVPKIIQGVTDVLEQKAVGLGTVTTHGLKEMLERVLRESGVEELVQSARNGRPIGVIEERAVNVERPVVCSYHMWGDQMHMVPEDFELPKSGLLQAWQAWV